MPYFQGFHDPPATEGTESWRLCECMEGWTARLIAAGALLLRFGYAVMLPLYDAGVIECVSSAGYCHSSATAFHRWRFPRRHRPGRDQPDLRAAAHIRPRRDRPGLIGPRVLAERGNQLNDRGR